MHHVRHRSTRLYVLEAISLMLRKEIIDGSGILPHDSALLNEVVLLNDRLGILERDQRYSIYYTIEVVLTLSKRAVL